MLPFSFVLLRGCEEEETDDPILSTSAAPSSSGPTTIETEDAGPEDAGDADADAATPKPKTARPVDRLRIGRCCAALERNKPMAPPSQHGAYDAAIAACEMARKNPAAIATVVKLLPSAPPVCQ